MTKEQLFEIMKGSIIVSCQATPGEPLYLKDDSIMYLMARAAKLAGAKMIRTSSARDIVAIKEETGLPVIGLIKREYPGYTGRITMTMKEVDECVTAMADIVSIDCTDCERGDGLTPAEFLKKVKEKYDWIGASHGCEFPYVFHNFEEEQEIVSGPVLHELADQTCGAWSSFVMNADPSYNGVEWPEYSLENRETMMFNDDGTTGVENDPLSEQRELMAPLMHYYNGL